MEMVGGEGVTWWLKVLQRMKALRAVKMLQAAKVLQGKALQGERLGWDVGCPVRSIAWDDAER